MAAVINILRYLLPVLAVSLAVVLLCFYLHAKKKRAAYDITIPTRQDVTDPVVCSISLTEDHPEGERHFERFPPRYSTVDHPPPYSLFDPMLTSVWPGGPPPAYEMYPITLPLAPHHWMQPAPSPSSAGTHNHAHPRRLHREPTACTSF